MLDTPAYAALFRVKYSGSLQCPCCRMPGVYIEELKTTTYNNHSMFLPDTNFLKVSDSSQQETAEATSFFESNNLLGESVKFEDLKNLSTCFAQDVEHKPYRPYERVDRCTYLHDGIEAETKRALKGINKFFKKDEIHINGVKGLTPFASLHYFDICNQTSADPMHCAMNVGRHTLRELSGKRACSESLHTYCKKRNIYPSIRTTPNGKSWIADWTLSSETTRNKVTTWVNCLLAPVGHKDNYQVANLFTQTGFLRATAVVDVLCNLLDFVLYADPEYCEEYRLLFHLYSLCFSRLMGTKIKKATYKQLCAMIIEISAIRDAMLPPSETPITCHQPVEIVHHIEKTGPTRCVQTSGNERALKALKAFLPVGGTQIDMVSFRRYIRFETERTNTYYSTEKLRDLMPEKNFYTIGRQLHYTDEPFFLYQPMNPGFQWSLTTDETAYLFFAITGNVYHRVSENGIKALQVSPLYRLLQCYENRGVYSGATGKVVKTQSKKVRELTFLQWMRCVIDEYDTSGGVVYFADNYNFVHANPSTDSSIADEIFERKSIYTKDIDIMRKMIAIDAFPISYNMYSRANIYGTAFRSRGFEKRETNVTKFGNYGGDKNMIKVTNNSNKLRYHWNKEVEYSSWCKYFDYNNQEEENYGQINAFLQLHVPFDPFIDGMCLASITSRKHINHMYIDHIYANDEASLAEHLFIPVTNIKATPLLVAGFSTAAGVDDLRKKFDRERKQLILPSTPEMKIKFWIKHQCAKAIYVGEKFFELIEFTQFVEKNYISLSYLVLIEMHRNRYNARYDKRKDKEYRKNFLPSSNNTMGTKWMHQLFVNLDYSISIE